MKKGRVGLSLIGLVFLLLAYITQNFLYLVIAILAFFVGLFLMGLLKTRQTRNDSNVPHDESRPSRRKKESKTKLRSSD